MARGIDGRSIFVDDVDRQDLLWRLDALLPATDARCYAWSFMSNHLHMVVQTGGTPLWRVMKRLNSGFARRFNLRHERKGYLFQDRYRSRLVDADADLMGVTRYVHLNPLRGGLVDTLAQLETHPWCGYGALLGIRPPHPFESVAWVGNLFGTATESRRSLRRWMRAHADCDDEALPGTGNPESTLSGAQTPPTPPATHSTPGRSLALIIEDVCRTRALPCEEVVAGGRQQRLADARATIAFLAVIENGCPTIEVAAALGRSPSAISHALDRGRAIVAAERAEVAPGEKPR